MSLGAELETGQEKSTREAFFIGSILCKIINEVDLFAHGKTVYVYLKQLESDDAFSSYAYRMFIGGTKIFLLKKMTELPSSFDQKVALLKIMSYDYLAGSPEKDIRNHFAMGHLYYHLDFDYHDHAENSFEQWIELFKILDHLYPTRDEDKREKKAFDEKKDRCWMHINRIIRNMADGKQKTICEIKHCETLKLYCNWLNLSDDLRNEIDSEIDKLNKKLEAMES